MEWLLSNRRRSQYLNQHNANINPKYKICSSKSQSAMLHYRHDVSYMWVCVRVAESAFVSRTFLVHTQVWFSRLAQRSIDVCGSAIVLLGDARMAARSIYAWRPSWKRCGRLVAYSVVVNFVCGVPKSKHLGTFRVSCWVVWHEIVSVCVFRRCVCSKSCLSFGFLCVIVWVWMRDCVC